MRHALKLHPHSHLIVTGVEAEAERSPPGILTLRYGLTGEISRLSVPPPGAATRADELWRHTCFEAFVGAVGGEGYYEFNFAPSRHWAAYRFDGYRQGMTLAQDVAAPAIEVEVTGERLDLRVVLDLGTAALPPEAAWRLGLSAVVEGADDSRAYWALAHPPGKADFHHADCFALELTANGKS